MWNINDGVSPPSVGIIRSEDNISIPISEEEQSINCYSRTRPYKTRLDHLHHSGRHCTTALTPSTGLSIVFVGLGIIFSFPLVR